MFTKINKWYDRQKEPYRFFVFFIPMTSLIVIQGLAMKYNMPTLWLSVIGVFVVVAIVRGNYIHFGGKKSG